MKIKKEFILDFLTNQKMAVLSTVRADGSPDAAPIFYVLKNESEFYFLSKKETQKIDNITANEIVVLTVTEEKTRETVMVRGKAEKIENDKDLPLEIMRTLSTKLNQNENFETNLPVLQHKGKTLMVVKVSPQLIVYRKYLENNVEEEILKF